MTIADLWFCHHPIAAIMLILVITVIFKGTCHAGLRLCQLRHRHVDHPGPNNLLLASSGVNFGLRRTLPMLFGICVGCAVQLAIIIPLLALALSWAGVIRLPLAVIGCAYLLWLSWKLFQAASPDAKEQAQPMSLLSGALFQAVNPKARLMVINVAILFTPREGATFVHTLSIIAGFALLNLPCVLLWAVLGDRLRNALRVT